MTTTIHPSAIVDDGAQLGDGCRVWHFVHISAGARIGERCSFGQNVFVGNDVAIGNNVKIQNNVSVYDAVTLEDDVFCGPSMVFTNVYNPRAVGPQGRALAHQSAAVFVLARDGAVVNRDVPDFALIVGVPARQVGWMSRFGERLELPLASEQPVEAVCPRTGDRYRLTGQQLQLIEHR